MPAVAVYKPEPNGYERMHRYIQDFALKMNKNSFKLNYANVSIDNLMLNPGEEREVKL